MNMENKYKTSGYVEISLIDVLIAVLKKWRIILFGMCIGTALLGGYAFINNSISDRGSAEEMQRKGNKSDDYKAIEKSIEVYSSTISANREYLDGSLYMNLDPSNVQVLEELYFVSSPEGNVAAVIKAFSTLIKSYEFCSEVSEAVGEDIKEQYLNELVLFDCSICRSYDIGADNMTGNYLTVLQELGKEPVTTFSIKIKGKDKVFCEKIGKCFENMIKENDPYISSKLGDFRIEKVDSVSYKQQENNIIAKKRSLLSQITTDEAAMEKLNTALKNSMTNAVAHSQVNTKKYILIGALLGMFLVFAFYSVKYICSDKLRTADDIEQMYGLKIFRVNNSDKSQDNRKPGKSDKPGKTGRNLTGMDRLIMNLQRRGHHSYDETSLAEMIRTLAIISKTALDGNDENAGKYGYDKYDKLKLFIAGNESTGKESICVLSLADKLRKMGIDVNIGSNPAYDAKSLEQLCVCDCVLFAEAVNRSSYVDIDKKLQCIKDFDIPVIGCIVEDL